MVLFTPNRAQRAHHALHSKLPQLTGFLQISGLFLAFMGVAVWAHARWMGHFTVDADALFFGVAAACGLGATFVVDQWLNSEFWQVAATDVFKRVERAIAQLGDVFGARHALFTRLLVSRTARHFEGQRLRLEWARVANGGVEVTVAFHNSSDSAVFLLTAKNPPVLRRHTFAGYNLDTDKDKLTHLKQRMSAVVAALQKMLDGQDADAPADAIAPAALSGLCDCAHFVTPGQAPWFTALVGRLQSAAQILEACVDLDSPEADDLANHLAPHTKAMFAAAQPLVRGADDLMYPELQAALTALVDRLEAYQSLSRQSAAQALAQQAEHVLRVSHIMPDPVLRAEAQFKHMADALRVSDKTHA